MQTLARRNHQARVRVGHHVDLGAEFDEGGSDVGCVTVVACNDEDAQPA